MNAGPTAPHLLVQDLRVGFRTFSGHHDVLRVSELHIDHGEAVGVVGESGSGKSVLALAVLRLLPMPPAMTSARLLALDEHDITSLSDKEMRNLRGREAAMIFQDPMSSLNPVFTVRSQLSNVIRRIDRCGSKEAKARAAEYVRLVGLPDPASTLSKYPHELSGGQRQRVIIALALSCHANLIIADEPTRNLDVTVQAGILTTIADLRRDLGVSLLFIANNLGLVSAMCDRVYILLDGRIVESGTVDEVIRDVRHPYTRLLLHAIPTTEERGRAVDGVGAVVVAGVAAPSADGVCTYQTRCRVCADECAALGAPELKSCGGTHLVACHAASNGAAPGGES